MSKHDAAYIKTFQPLTYHVGFLKAGRTLVIQAVRDKDCLSCETWKYYGEREITKKELKEKKGALLAAVNDLYGKRFDRVRVQ